MSNYHEIPTHMTISEKKKLHDLAHGIRIINPVVVEIGSYLGASSCFLADGLKGLYSGKLHCVDTWMNDAMNNIARKDVYPEFLENIRDFDDIIIPHRGRSIEIATEFEKHSVNMIFFDGSHDKEVADDWFAWEHTLKPGAIVVFHDWSWAPAVQSLILGKVHSLVKYFDTLPNLWWGWLK